MSDPKVTQPLYDANPDPEWAAMEQRIAQACVPVVLDTTPEKLPNDTEDARVFGPDAWVYCGSHLRPHLTGWCTVGVDNKLGLGIIGGNTDENRAEATRKCQRFNLTLYKGDWS